MDNYTVEENTNSYNVTGLRDSDNYNVIKTAVGVCGMIKSDPVTVYCECVSTYVLMTGFEKSRLPRIIMYKYLEIPILII